jgi:hypothetical protein
MRLQQQAIYLNYSDLAAVITKFRAQLPVYEQEKNHTFFLIDLFFV